MSKDSSEEEKFGETREPASGPLVSQIERVTEPSERTGANPVQVSELLLPNNTPLSTDDGPSVTPTDISPKVTTPTLGFKDTVEFKRGTASASIPANVSSLGGERLIIVLENYLEYYASGESHTARAKRYDLQHFLQFLAGSAARVNDVLVSDWTLQSTKNFIDHRLEIGEAPATVSRRLATIKHFGRTLAERVHGYINPAREAKAPMVQPSRPSGLTIEEITLLRRAAEEMAIESKNSFLPLRNRFLLELLLGTGLRADEVRLLVLNQLSEDLSWLRNVKTKGKKFRNVYLDTAIRPLLQEYLERRENILIERYPGYRELPEAMKQRFPVFLSLYRAEINNAQSFGLAPKTIWRIIASFGNRAQAISDSTIGSLHPHKLRHTFAHGLLDSSKDVRLVAQALGHSDVRTTMRYTERSDEQLAKAIEIKTKGGH